MLDSCQHVNESNKVGTSHVGFPDDVAVAVVLHATTQSADV